jgi:hypothetical protein
VTSEPTPSALLPKFATFGSRFAQRLGALMRGSIFALAGWSLSDPGPGQPSPRHGAHYNKSNLFYQFALAFLFAFTSFRFARFHLHLLFRIEPFQQVTDDERPKYFCGRFWLIEQPRFVKWRHIL